MELVIVERVYDQPVSEEQVAEVRRKAAPCFEMRRVKHRKTYWSKDRLRAICIYDAPDAATVREAHDQEGVAYARIWSALPGDDSADP